MGAAQCGICCGEREKGPDHETRQRHATAVPGNASLPDLLTNRRPKASDDDKGKEAPPVDKFEESQRGAEQDSSGSKEALLADVEEPQRGAVQEAKGKKQKAAEEREAFLRALLEEHAEAERLEMMRKKEAKRQAMLVRLEVVNQTIRKEYQNCIHHPAKVSFDVEVQEIGQHVGACSHVIAMKKDFNFVSFEGWMRVFSFLLMSVVLILNIIATYVSMAQTYHTYRLETAGPTGFEIATSYYLNPNIVAWRHIAVKCLLNGLPLYLISTGIRVSMSFNIEDQKDFQKMSQTNSRILAFVVLGMFFISGCIMHYVHQKHQAVFRGNYEYAKMTERPYIEKVHELMSSTRSRPPSQPDV